MSKRHAKKTKVSGEELAEIEAFRRAGQDYSVREIAVACGISSTQVQRLLDGTHGRPYKRTRRAMRAFIAWAEAQKRGEWLDETGGRGG